MGKALFITEKPSVAQDYVKVLNVNSQRRDGYLEGDKAIFTWCVGHLVTMSYPEAYDVKYKKWTLDTLPFLPKEYKYEVIPTVSKQFSIVKSLMLREDVDTIYVCTDSGREGEYIYRLVEQMVGVKDKVRKRVWIDSQTEDEVKRGIKEAKDLEEFDSLAHSAYLRAKEDYLQGINFSRILTLIYGRTIAEILNEKSTVVAVGRVMSCVLGMIVDREREIINFKKDFFYKIQGTFNIDAETSLSGEWKVTEESKYFQSPLLYSDNGFKNKEDAEGLIKDFDIKYGVIKSITKSKEKKNPPMLFNLAELQNQCSKLYKISPEETLKVIQSLYEKKMLTYPRTDARVLSKAVAKEINKNILGLKNHPLDYIKTLSQEVISDGSYKTIEKTKYVDDTKITDHYAIIPTGQGLDNYNKLNDLEKKMYDLVVKRFLSIFYPAAEYSKISIEIKVLQESFFISSKVLVKEGYLKVLNVDKDESKNEAQKEEKLPKEVVEKLKKGMPIEINEFIIKEGETSPPKRYTSGSIILAMENAGKLIEDEELREHIKSSGIGTSATRAEILKKLEKIQYISLNKKTQILTPTLKGELVYEVIKESIPALLNPTLTASWEKGLKLVSDKEISMDIFMDKLESHIKANIEKALNIGRVINNDKLFSSISTLKDSDLPKEENLPIGLCPMCKNGLVKKNKKGYCCSNYSDGCSFFIGKIAGVDITMNDIKELTSKGRTKVIQGFKSKEGKTFSAKLAIKNNNVVFDFN